MTFQDLKFFQACHTLKSLLAAALSLSAVALSVGSCVPVMRCRYTFGKFCIMHFPCLEEAAVLLVADKD